jgi:EAL domain-containing protein (putative c-di-GMP-specific phosphodiesterase class I)
VVAEGIETETQLKLVTSQGCHEGQGYLFGHPMTADAIRARMTTVSQLVA